MAIMTSPRFEQLRPGDSMSVVLHATNFLLNDIDDFYFTAIAGVREAAEQGQADDGSRNSERVRKHQQ
jgi:hypothetical protein